MSPESQLLVLHCPRCDALVSARPDQAGSQVECPLCHQPFEVQPPAGQAPDLPSTGQIFHFQCRRCGSILEARSSQGGQSGKCPTCAAIFNVPLMDPKTGLATGDADPGDDGENPTPVHAYAAAGSMAPKLIRNKDESISIVCPRCETESPVTANNCPNCGLPFTMDGASAVAITTASSRAQTAWMLALIGLVFSFCAGIGAILGVIAIGMGISALHDRHLRKIPALAAIALGIADCVIAAVIIVRML